MKCSICFQTALPKQKCCRNEIGRLRTRCNRLEKYLDEKDREISKLTTQCEATRADLESASFWRELHELRDL